MYVQNAVLHRHFCHCMGRRLQTSLWFRFAGRCYSRIRETAYRLQWCSTCSKHQHCSYPATASANPGDFISDVLPPSLILGAAACKQQAAANVLQSLAVMMFRSMQGRTCLPAIVYLNQLQNAASHQLCTPVDVDDLIISDANWET